MPDTYYQKETGELLYKGIGRARSEMESTETPIALTTTFVCHPAKL